jgi:hypothetical protein
MFDCHYFISLLLSAVADGIKIKNPAVALNDYLLKGTTLTALLYINGQ